MGLAAFIQDLAIILITAAVVTVIAKQFKQPVILGYLVAGLLLSPSLGLFKQASNPEGIQTWASIGIIFLMFNLGMEFSFRRLMDVGRGAVITAFSGMLFTFTLGFLVAQSIGYDQVDSTFIGGMLCLSSTMIILKSLEDLNLKSRPSSQLLFGVMIIEDLVSILLLVLLSTFAATRSLSGTALLTTTVSLLLFIGSWLFLGMFFLPRILRSIRLHLNEETTLIVSLGLCLLMVLIATKAGFSAALGAFVMGSLLAETKESDKIMQMLKPIQHLFAAIFFVSVGMLIDPQVLFDESEKVLLFLLIVVFGKPVGVGIGAIVSGRSLKDSVAVGLSMPQIGEFSFIIASLGFSLGVVDQTLYPIIVAVSCVSVFFTPILMSKTKPIYNWLDLKIPSGMRRWINRYDQAMLKDESVGLFGRLMQAYAPMFVVSILAVFITVFLVNTYLVNYAIEALNLSERTVRLILTGFTLSLLSPFLWAILYKPVRLEGLSTSAEQVVKNFKFVFIVLRFIVALALGLYVSGKLLGGRTTALIFFAAVVVGAGLLSKYLGAFYSFLERTYFLADDVSSPTEGEPSSAHRYTPWDGGMTAFVVPLRSDVIGLTLIESKIKERFGATVVVIERSGQKIIAPRATERILPFDRLFFVGDEAQLSELEKFFKSSEDDILIGLPEDNFKLDSFEVGAQSAFNGKSIKLSGLSERVTGLVVGIERAGKQLHNPSPDEIITQNDRLWLVGLEDQITVLKKAEALS